jgi:hypothetical protein
MALTLCAVHGNIKGTFFSRMGDFGFLQEREAKADL